MRAFESSPVHWVNLHPCLNLRSPGKGGTSTILSQGGETQHWLQKSCCLPVVNLVDNPGPTHRTMHTLKILTHPLNKVVFENTFDQLVQQISRDEFEYVSSWEVWGVWLIILSMKSFFMEVNTYHSTRRNAI